MKLVIVTGMSGAGKTIALKMLEDIGFYCVDNLPISLVDKFVQLVSEGTSIEKAALGLDIRSGKSWEIWMRSWKTGAEAMWMYRCFSWMPMTQSLLNVIKRLAGYPSSCRCGKTGKRH